MQATQDDPIYFVSEEAPRSLFLFFTVKLMAKCCFCGKGYDAESLSFKRQGHAVSVNMSCLCGDSMKWSSSPIMGGAIPKYVNMKYVDILHFSLLRAAEFCYYMPSLFCIRLPNKLQVLIIMFKFSVYVIEWFMGFCPVA